MKPFERPQEPFERLPKRTGHTWLSDCGNNLRQVRKSAQNVQTTKDTWKNAHKQQCPYDTWVFNLFPVTAWSNSPHNPISFERNYWVKQSLWSGGRAQKTRNLLAHVVSNVFCQCVLSLPLPSSLTHFLRTRSAFSQRFFSRWRAPIFHPKTS